MKIIKYIQIALIIVPLLFILEYRLNLIEIVHKTIEKDFFNKKWWYKKLNGWVFLNRI